jgi:hypothetical protein
MGWKATGQPTVRQQRDRWVVRVDGIDTDDWVASRTDIGPKTKSQYEWAAGHIRTGLGSLRADQLDRTDIARWLEALAAGGTYSRRSIGIFRMVLRAALA